MLCGELPLTKKSFIRVTGRSKQNSFCKATQGTRDQINLPNDIHKLFGEECPVACIMEYLLELRILANSYLFII